MFITVSQLLKTYHDIVDGQKIQMENEEHSKVIGKGNIDIIFTSRKNITLTNILHVLNINRNLASEVLSKKSRIKSILESDKLVLARNRYFVDKGYSNE